MSRTERLLEMLIALRTRTRFTVQEMADEFGVSRRTMLRDLQALSEMGVPLSATPGPHGGYALISSQRLLPLSLTVDEAIGMVLSYESFMRYPQTPFAAESLSAIVKLRNAMPPDVLRELDRVHAHVAVLEPRREYDAPLLQEMLRAALDGVHLDIVYDSASGRSTRRIFPYGLFAEGGFWYCACHDYRRETRIVLRVDRILEAERVEGVEAPDGTGFREWLSRYRTDAPDLIQLRARVTRRGVRNIELSTLFGPIPVDEGGEGKIDTVIPRSDLEYFAGRLLTLGDDLIVEAPSELIAAMRDKAAAVAAMYASTEM